MATQTGVKTEKILREKKATLYKLHPNQNECFGHVITMPNLPFGLVERDHYLNEKGYKRTPQELMPLAEVQKNDGGEVFLVPEGYELKSVTEKTEFNKAMIDAPVWKVVKVDKESTEMVCPECGKTCASKLGLGSHMKSHELKNKK